MYNNYVIHLDHLDCRQCCSGVRQNKEFLRLKHVNSAHSQDLSIDFIIKNTVIGQKCTEKSSSFR